MTADTVSIFCIVAHVDGFYRNLDFDLHACSLDLLTLCIHQDAVSIDGRSRIQLRHITGILTACKFHRIMFRQLALENILVAIGQNDMDAGLARQLLGPDKILGVTAKTVEQALKAQSQGADYLGSGAVFGTSTKKDARPMTMEQLQAICASVKIPVVAIGGICLDNIEKLQGSGAAG